MKRHYGLGTAKECRLHVQKLNGIRGHLDEIKETTKHNGSTDEDEQSENDAKVTRIKLQNNSSKWSDFVDEDVIEPDREPNEPMYLGNSEVVLEVPTKKRKFTKPKQVTTVNPSHSKVLNHFGQKRKSPSPPPMILYESVVSVKPENNILDEECEIVNAKDNIKPEKQIVKNLVLQKLNTNSKWAQFADDDEENRDDYNLETNDENESNDVNPIEGNINSNEELPKNIFELCDENDLDDVLNF